MAKDHRKTIATFLLLALFLFGVPALDIAGGCDEPGYTGGSCGKADGGEGQGSSSADLGGGSGGLGDEPAENGGGGSPGLTVPGTSTESGSDGHGFLGNLAILVLNWLTVAPTP